MWAGRRCSPAATPPSGKSGAHPVLGWATATLSHRLPQAAWTQVYGLTEGTPIITSRGGEPLRSRSVGTPRPLAEVRVQDVTVIGVPDAPYLEAACPIIVRTPDHDLDANGLVAYCRQHLASCKKLCHVLFVAELPRAPPGKVPKQLLRAQSRLPSEHAGRGGGVQLYRSGTAWRVARKLSERPCVRSPPPAGFRYTGHADRDIIVAT